MKIIKIICMIGLLIGSTNGFADDRVLHLINDQYLPNPYIVINKGFRLSNGQTVDIPSAFVANYSDYNYGNNYYLHFKCNMFGREAPDQMQVIFNKEKGIVDAGGTCSFDGYLCHARWNMDPGGVVTFICGGLPKKV